MLELVTIEEGRIQIRSEEGTPDDQWLAIWIPAISEAVAGWLKYPWRLYEPEVDSDGAVVVDSAGEPVLALDTAGDPIPRWRVKAAVLVELASAYRFREGEGTDNTVPDAAGHGYVLNKAATALLASLRKPTIA